MHRKLTHVAYPKESSRRYVSNTKSKEVGGIPTDAINKITGETNQISKTVIDECTIGKVITNTIS